MKNRSELKRYQNLPMSTVDLSVAFHDVDALEVVWHGNYIKYFEIARCSVLEAINYDYPQMKASGYAWPIVDIRSRFVLPVQYGEQLQVTAIILEWELRLLIRYLVINKKSQRVVTRGRSVQVPLKMKTMSMEFGCPELLKQKIESWIENNISSCEDKLLG